MKRGSTVFASILLILCAGVLLLRAGKNMTGEQVQALGNAALQRQFGTVAVLAEMSLEEAAAGSAEEPMPGVPVPVTTVEEAWDELAREKAQETTPPEPVTVDGGGTLELRNETGYTVDLASLPALPRLDARQEGQPLVLIMHTHGSESYTEPGVSGYRTQDETKNVIAIGDAIARVLEERGYGVIHDKTLCDYPEYTGAYNRSREVIQKNLKQYPGIMLVLDIHRDAVENSDGSQMRMACTTEAGEAAQLMLVVGTDAGGLEHPGWKTNLALGAVLQMRLSQQNSDLMRPLNLRTERFNQDLAPMTLLVEVGASGNTLQEAKMSAELFGNALAGLLDDCGGKYS